MKRGPIMLITLLIELIVAVILLMNYQYLATTLQLSPAASGPSLPADGSSLAAVNEIQSAVRSASTAESALLPALSPAVFSLFSVLPAEAAPFAYTMSEPLVTLGRTLFYDPRLSINQAQSCNTCHVLDRYGVDNVALSPGHNGVPVKRNTPTVYNAALHLAQFWDGRSPTVEDQAKGPILAADEMGMLDGASVERILQGVPGYTPLFVAAFPADPNPITFEHVTQALGAFERRLLTPSRFDRFLAGDYSQLTELEQQGLATFVNLGCPNCHVGVTVGGLQFKKLGEKEDYPIADVGRFAVTGLEADRYVFKVPSLRNVAQTAPYLHDGSIPTLEEMVTLMARYQLGRQVTPDELTTVVAFLQSLTGELPTNYIAPPPLP
ncbi:MAG: cytochrome C biogenesis protein CcsA [Caldilineaceae bacterium]|nr:cytochrome C biogenesis protein CcsA [Caldilineaceae bacterium]